jgi:hypothetical protein
MYHSLSLFLAPESAVSQATPNSPPAKQPVRREPAEKRSRIRFMAGVLGNAIGFGVLLTGCWFSLQLMQLAL